LAQHKAQKYIENKRTSISILQQLWHVPTYGVLITVWSCVVEQKTQNTYESTAQFVSNRWAFCLFKYPTCLNYS